ncbi:DNA recombination protein RmuC [Endozoicomonas euniceicola]|uniref:DNA recombination protein RmuC n=1 Tax=Endozoicomonas euniceicola TaxID=1234143 RepID=A0ABY6GYZ8_9GAMM|nr:DNA recombination protein RmuC [Endozoicomonas euniceicola]UYM17792.1 DNA recombination protein RmuC [Endozoicomonas euniceicola]
MSSTTVIVAAIVAVLSSLLSWLVARQKNLRTQAELETLLSSEQDRVTERDQRIRQGEDDRTRLLERIEVERENRSEAEQAVRELRARLEVQQQHNEKTIKDLEDNRETQKQAFHHIASEILEAKGKLFSQQHQERLDTLLKPFKEQLGDFRNKVEQAQQADIEGRAALKQQLETLHSLNQRITDEAGNLARALKGDKKLQGNWGELQVEKILESSGLIKGEEYEREANFKDDEGQNKRPDFVVYLPEGKHLIIDSKVSLVDYMAYVNAEDDDERQSALSRHILSIRNHIKGLGDKDYPNLPGVKTPDFVFMFMPVEPAFIAAFQHDQKLFNDAFEQNIVVVTPTTLLATLRTVANLWTIERQNANARKLADRAGLVYDKLRVFVEKMEKLDTQLTTTRNTYDEAMNTLKQGRGNLISQTNEFVALGVRVKKEFSRQTLDTSDLSQLTEKKTQ